MRGRRNEIGSRKRAANAVLHCIRSFFDPLHSPSDEAAFKQSIYDHVFVLLQEGCRLCLSRGAACGNGTYFSLQIRCRAAWENQPEYIIHGSGFVKFGWKSWRISLVAGTQSGVCPLLVFQNLSSC